ALFKMMVESASDPVLEAVYRRILQDESRHMGFGMLALPEVVHGASPAERGELEDYTCFAVEKTLTGFFPLEAYEDAGFSRAQIEEAKRYRRDVAARNDYAPFRKVFKRDMHAAMVGNLARLGLLTERVRPRLDKLGRSEEHTSELQSRGHLVCRLLLEKKKKKIKKRNIRHKTVHTLH